MITFREANAIRNERMMDEVEEAKAYQSIGQSHGLVPFVESYDVWVLENIYYLPRKHWGDEEWKLQALIFASDFSEQPTNYVADIMKCNGVPDEIAAPVLEKHQQRLIDIEHYRTEMQYQYAELEDLPF